jgi:hypothetical protein
MKLGGLHPDEVSEKYRVYPQAHQSEPQNEG